MYASRCVLRFEKRRYKGLKPGTPLGASGGSPKPSPLVSLFQGCDLVRARRVPDSSFRDAGKSGLLRPPKSGDQRHLTAEM
jgi:hypothetical protein